LEADIAGGSGRLGAAASWAAGGVLAGAQAIFVTLNWP